MREATYLLASITRFPCAPICNCLFTRVKHGAYLVGN
jgi:hypothetical protein